MVKVALLIMAGFALGLYSGKLRASGMGWNKIVCSFISDSRRVIVAFAKGVYSPFRKGERGSSKKEEVIEPEVM